MATSTRTVFLQPHVLRAVFFSHLADIRGQATHDFAGRPLPPELVGGFIAEGLRVETTLFTEAAEGTSVL